MCIVQVYGVGVVNVEETYYISVSSCLSLSLHKKNRYAQVESRCLLRIGTKACTIAHISFSFDGFVTNMYVLLNVFAAEDRVGVPRVSSTAILTTRRRSSKIASITNAFLNVPLSFKEGVVGSNPHHTSLSCPALVLVFNVPIKGPDHNSFVTHII